MILNARKLIRQNDSQAEMESGLRARLNFAKNATSKILHIPDQILKKNKPESDTYDVHEEYMQTSPFMRHF
jgi:hypothetical protein